MKIKNWITVEIHKNVHTNDYMNFVNRYQKWLVHLLHDEPGHRDQWQKIQAMHNKCWKKCTIRNNGFEYLDHFRWLWMAVEKLNIKAKENQNEDLREICKRMFGFLYNQKRNVCLDEERWHNLVDGLR